MAKPKSSSFLRRWAVKREVERIKDAELYIVLYWPDASHHVPEVKGPYYSREHCNEVRNAVRASQGREERMAQSMPLSRYPRG